VGRAGSLRSRSEADRSSTNQGPLGPMFCFSAVQGLKTPTCDVIDHRRLQDYDS